MASSRPARSGRSLNVVQVISFSLAFILVAGIGGVLSAGLFLPLIGATGAIVKSSVKMFDELPADLETVPLSEMSEIFWSDGSSMAKIYKQDRIVVSLEEISPFLQDAVVAIEDRRFFEHGGIDPKGMIRAAVSNFTKSNTQGASTLTQQYVKNSLLNAAGDDLIAIDEATDQTIGRKLREAKLAVSLEKTMSKQDILAGYLNIAQFGRSVYGAEAASKHYFGVHASELTLDQAVLLAGITQNPSHLDPGVPANLEDATNRRAQVVNAMVQTDKLTKEEGEALKAVPVAELVPNITANPNGCQSAGNAAYFCNYVVRVISLSDVFGATPKERTDMLYKNGLKIYTTLDKNMQNAAEASVMKLVPADNKHGVAHGLVTTVPGTGEIRAMTQSRYYVPGKSDNPAETTMNYNVDYAYDGGAGIQPGSAFKPFALATALKNGASLSDIVDATPRPYAAKEFRVGGCENAATSSGYQTKPPGNSEGHSTGPMSIAAITAASVNTGYINLVSTRMTLCEFWQTSVDLGIHSAVAKYPFKVVPSTVLGVAEVAPLTMAASYGAFAAGGVLCDPVAITKIEDRDGNPIPVPSGNCRQAISPQVAAGVTTALIGALGSGGTGKGQYVSGRPSAGKTGTTNGNNQVWFVGYTAQLSTASWVTTPSNPGKASLRNLTLGGRPWRLLWGANLPLESWQGYMNQASQGMEVKGFGEAPASMIETPVPPPAASTVPDVTGQPWRQARDTLRGAGFVVTVNENYVSSAIARDTVVNTVPAAGAAIEPGGAITIHVSNGRQS